MHRFRNVVIAASVAALAVTALAAPASAGPGKATIGIVNGIPNQSVDICVNGKELRSAAKYGKAVAKVVQAGSKTVVIRKASPGVCDGAKIARKVVNLPVGDDVTLVITKKTPKWVKFRNVGLGQIWPEGVPATGAYLALRHAADLGKASLRIQLIQTVEVPLPPIPTVDYKWLKGNETLGPITPQAGIKSVATAGRVNKRNFVRSVSKQWKPGFRYEYYLLGTWTGNAKMIVWTRPITEPAP